MGREAPAQVRVEDPRASPLSVLLALEASARDAATAVELAHIIANDWRKIVPAEQIFVGRVKSGRAAIVAVTGMSSVDRTSPLIHSLEQGLTRELRQSAEPRALEMGKLSPEKGGDLAEHPYGSCYLLPLRREAGAPFGFVLLARETAWTDAELPVVTRLGGAFAHAWRALEGEKRLIAPAWPRRLAPYLAIAGVMALFIPVPLTALAPVEVVGRDAEIVTAPLDGVIQRIELYPNAPVRAGDLVVTLVDTALRGRLAVAEQNVLVAEARERRLAQAALADRAARRELAVAQAELGLAVAEANAAREALDRATVRASRDGIAVYQNRSELEGKPVTVGERLMAVADPGAVEYRIELPVKDVIVAREQARARIYLDADPLSPLDARLQAVTFHASPLPGGGLAFVLRAQPAEGTEIPRIGHRGVAQIFGERVALGYYLLRRPLMFLRQTLGL